MRGDTRLRPPPAGCAGPHRENWPEVGVPWRPVPSARMAVSLPCGVMRGSSDAPPAGLRPAVPTGGRRSPAAGAICTNGGVFALRSHAGEQRCAARWPAASCADRRPAFPDRRHHLDGGVPVCSSGREYEKSGLGPRRTRPCGGSSSGSTGKWHDWPRTTGRSPRRCAGAGRDAPARPDAGSRSEPLILLGGEPVRRPAPQGSLGP